MIAVAAVTGFVFGMFTATVLIARWLHTHYESYDR